MRTVSLVLMKKLCRTAFCLCLFIACSKKTDPQNLTVTWSFGPRDVDTLSKIPWQLLDAIDEGKIKTYDNSLREMSREEVESKISLGMRDVFLTQEEMDIMMANGDTSFGEYLQPKQTAEQLRELFKQSKSIDSLLIPQYRPAFETKVLQLALVEEVKLDTTLRKQNGSWKYIRLMIPKEYNKSGMEEMLCQVKYEDFVKLNWPQQRILEQHDFIMSAERSDLAIQDGQYIHRLSSIIKATSIETGADSLRNSVFKYFGKNIMVVVEELSDSTTKDMTIVNTLY